jgi:outer membrane biosynthesis protein TonB
MERMPTSELPTSVNEPTPGGPAEPAPEPREQERTHYRGSRWVDYDTHELLEMISELEDERRWARLREGIWIAILVHALLLSAITWIPKYIFKVPAVIDPIDAIRDRKDLTYLDTPEALRELQKSMAKPIPPIKPPQIDKKTLEEMNKPTAPPVPVPVPQPKEVPAPPVQQAQQQPPPVPPSPQSQSQFEAPRPAAVPARPNFATSSGNPADQLREAMRGASRSPGGYPGGSMPMGGLSRHPGASGGGVEVLSDTQGVDFGPYIQRVIRETYRTWDPLIPEEVNPPISKSGQTEIVFTILPNGRVAPGGMNLTGSSGDTALDRAAWGALTDADYPPLPREFHGPYLQLRFRFMYNMEPAR